MNNEMELGSEMTGFNIYVMPSETSQMVQSYDKRQQQINQAGQPVKAQTQMAHHPQANLNVKNFTSGIMVNETNHNYVTQPNVIGTIDNTQPKTD